jgi:hypothetical protein
VVAAFIFRSAWHLRIRQLASESDLVTPLVAIYPKQVRFAITAAQYRSFNHFALVPTAVYAVTYCSFLRAL